MPRDVAAIPFLDLPAALRQLKERYEVKTLERQTIAADGTTWPCLEAVKKDNRAKGPKRVKIYYQLETFRIRRIVFDRAHTQGQPSPKRITLDLVSEGPLPADWFRPAAHRWDSHRPPG